MSSTHRYQRLACSHDFTISSWSVYVCVCVGGVGAGNFCFVSLCVFRDGARVCIIFVYQVRVLVYFISCFAIFQFALFFIHTHAHTHTQHSLIHSRTHARGHTLTRPHRHARMYMRTHTRTRTEALALLPAHYPYQTSNKNTNNNNTNNTNNFTQHTQCYSMPLNATHCYPIKCNANQCYPNH